MLIRGSWLPAHHTHTVHIHRRIINAEYRLYYRLHSWSLRAVPDSSGKPFHSSIYDTETEKSRKKTERDRASITDRGEGDNERDCGTLSSLRK